MFSQDQINVLYGLVEKGAVTKEDVDSFLREKLKEVGFVVTPQAQTEQPAEQPVEPVPPASEQPAA